MGGIVAVMQSAAVVAAPLAVALLCLYAYHRRLGADHLQLWAVGHLLLALTLLVVQMAPPRSDPADMHMAWGLASVTNSAFSWLVLFGVIALDDPRLTFRRGLLAVLAVSLLIILILSVDPRIYMYTGMLLNPVLFFISGAVLVWRRRSTIYVLAGIVLVIRSFNGLLYVISVHQAGVFHLPPSVGALAVFLNLLTGIALLAIAFENAWGRLHAALAEARDARQEADAILDMAPISILRKDADRRVVRASRYAIAIARTYGASPDMIIGSRNEDVMPPVAAGELNRMDQRLLGDPSSGPLEGEVTIPAPDGQAVTLLVRKTAMTDIAGNVTGIISASLDISNLKQIEARLREQILLAENASKAKSDFLANMSHELRTPLNGISGFAEMLSAGYVGPLTEKQKEYLENILTSSHHMLALVSRILDLSRLDSGAIALQRRPADLGAVVAEVLADAAPMAAEHNIELHSRILPAIASIDVVAMKQVLTNLLSNAVRFNRPGGKVSVDMRQQDGRTAIVISDTGIGMTPAQIAAAGDPFLRTDPFKSRSGGGAGLGLAVSRGLVELHGGELVIASVSDSGTTVTVSL